MTVSDRIWHGDWLAKIHERVRARGMPSISAFAETRPTATLLELAAELGDDIAAIQIEGALRYEAEKTGELERFARDLLVRRMRQRLPAGWSMDEQLALERAGVFASWSAGVHGLLDKSNRRAVWEALKHADIPTGWLPEGPDDSILERAFAGIRFDAPASE